MNAENLSDLANRANIHLKDKKQEGFISCYVYGEPPEGICYSFDSYKNAYDFMSERQLGDKVFNMKIEGSSLYEERVAKTYKQSNELEVTSNKKWWQFWK